jgi:hypothetical protein
MARASVATGDRAHADDTNEEESGEKRQSFLAMSRLEANVRLATLNVQYRIQS